jgi:hypothetical protein
MAGGLTFFLATNILRMHNFVMSNSKTRIPLQAYISEAWRFIYHFFTQERYATCEDNKPWLAHFLLVIGYVTMLVQIVFFLPWFQTDNIYPIYHPQRWLGYFATIVLLYGSGRALWGRIKKSSQLHRFSHLSDWMFPILLLVGTISGILVHLFRYAGLPLLTYYTYVIHLAFMVPMLVLEVPFGKWSHLAYRPLAVFFQAVKDKATMLQQTAVAATAGSD